MFYHRGLIIVYPHGTYIKEGSKKLIIKSIKLKNIAGKPLLLIEQKVALGILYLGEPQEITLAEFRKLRDQHLITKKERIKWWKGKRKLYSYKIIKKKIYKRPYKIEYGQGPQVLVKPENVRRIS